MPNKFHYVYSREGIMSVVSRAAKLSNLKSKAIKSGFIPSKIVGGIEYFDYDQLMCIGHAPNYLSIQIKKQIKKAKKGKSLQLLLF